MAACLRARLWVRGFCPLALSKEDDVKMDQTVPELDDAALELPAAQPPSRLRKIVGWIFKVGLLGGIFGWLIYKKSIKVEDLSELAQRWPWALLALGLFVFSLFFVALRYQLLLKALGMTTHYRDIVAVCTIGLLFDLISPVSSGGDLVKAFYVSRTSERAGGKKNRGLVLLSVLLDRIVGFFGLFMLGLIVCVLAWPQIGAHENLRHLAMFFAAVCAGSLMVFFILSSEKLEHSALRKRLMHKLPFHAKIEQVYAGFAGLRHHKMILLAMLGLSLLNHIIACVVILLLAQGMQFPDVVTGALKPLDIVPCLTILPLGFFINTFGIAGGLGVGNAGFELLFEHVLGIKGGARLILFYQIVSIVYRLMGMPVFFLYKHESRPTGAALEG